MVLPSPTVKLGGYPRFWRRNGTYWDGLERVSPADAQSLEDEWREAHVRIEWLASQHGRLDHALPQNLRRQAARQNIRSWIERKRS